MPAQLIALNNGPSILLDKPILLLGRDMECDIRLDSRKISRRHCCIAQVGENLVVRDLGSTNGVRINGERVIEGRLRPGDELTIGNFTYQIRWDSAVDEVPKERQRLEKQIARHGPTDRPPNEDEILEECDEPVPLVEPDGGPLQGTDKPPPELLAPEILPVIDVELEATDKPPYPGIVPDDLELAPPSDIYKNPPPPVRSD